MATTTTTTTTETKPVDPKKLKANDALRQISAALRPFRGQLTKARTAEQEAKRAERLRHYLEELRTGKFEDEKSLRFNHYTALRRVKASIKLGATAEDLRGCTALMQVAPWAQCEDALRQFAEASDIDPEILVAGLCGPAEKPAEKPQGKPEKPAEKPQGKPEKPQGKPEKPQGKPQGNRDIILTDRQKNRRR